jgi:hypothetical protein
MALHYRSYFEPLLGVGFGREGERNNSPIGFVFFIVSGPVRRFYDVALLAKHIGCRNKPRFLPALVLLRSPLPYLAEVQLQPTD